MTETDEQFVERMRGYLRANLEADDAARLEALARRGADAADEIERLRAALDAIREATDMGLATSMQGAPYLITNVHTLARAALGEQQ